MGITADMAVFFGVVVVVIVVVIVAVVVVLTKVLRTARDWEDGLSFTGPALQGTACVCAVQPTGNSISRYNRPPEYLCQIALRVQVSARQPYEVTVRQLVETFKIPSVQVGATVPVQVDSANPQNVRIDFSRSIAPPQAAPGLAASATSPAVAAPPSFAAPQPSISQRLQELETLRAIGEVTDEEYKAKRSQIISEI